MTTEAIRCNSCGEDKDPSAFAVRSKVTGKRAGWCRECQKTYRAKHYYVNSPKYKQQAAEWVANNKDTRKRVARHSNQKVRREQKRLAVEYKGGACVDCGGVFPLAVYDFHHLDPATKDASLAMLLNRWGFEAAKDELDKCVLLCSNCHRIRHFNE